MHNYDYRLIFDRCCFNLQIVQHLIKKKKKNAVLNGNLRNFILKMESKYFF